MATKRIDETREEFLARLTRVVSSKCYRYFNLYKRPVRLSVAFAGWAYSIRKHDLTVPEAAEIIAEKAQLYVHFAPEGQTYILPRGITRTKESLELALDCMLVTNNLTYDPELV